MRPIIAALFFIVSALPGAGAAAPGGKAPNLSQLPPPANATVDFARDIRPLLADRCVKCHGPEKQKGGLRLDAKAPAMQGGDDGKIIELGKSAESRLIHLVAGLEADTVMPPKDKGERLTAVQIGMLRAWIDQGANWPDDGKVAKLRSDHWSLQPLKMPAAPAAALDAFVQAKLAAKGLALSPEADPRTLIRRVTFDLTGLPPTPEEVEAFAESYGANGTHQSHEPHPAYRALVDRLLASPRYGERWGRHWLDVARYTESQGFEYDRLRDNAWHYRDYVIRAFNADKPYDRFMREQIAGDLLDPVTTDGMVAPSLLVCGPWDQAGNAQANATQKMITREDELEDLLGVVGQTFLGLTVNCARCHAHKFDPIPHEDYYRMKAVFEGVKHGEREIAIADAQEEPAKNRARRAELGNAIVASAKTVAQLEAAGAKAAAGKRPATAPPPGPAALARWTFDGSPASVMPGRALGGAEIAHGRLKLAKPGAFFKTEPLPRDIGERTLEAWVSLATVEQGGGAAISLETSKGGEFDAIVFGERQPKKWMAGSANFARTQDLALPDETAAPGTLIHVAMVYRADQTIAFFRNGQPAGKAYSAKSLATYKAGDGHVLLGLRHTGAGGGYLSGEIAQAALYDRALSAAEIAASFRAGGSSVSPAEILAALTVEQRAARENALAEGQKLSAALESLPPAKPPRRETSYVGTRVQPSPTKRLVRGDVHSPAEIVAPGALVAVFNLESDFGLAADAPEAQRRLKFADWLADARNPLPARVMVNRVWHLHFGQGLVATPNDFGASGTKPTHPELLDWLAGKFIASGWSVKALHRLILNSATYRQSSSVQYSVGSIQSGASASPAAATEHRTLNTEYFQKAAALDADNTLLWRFSPRRLEAEAVRDAMLAVSGQLDLQMGGPSFRGASYASDGKGGPDSNRRTVYRMNVNSGKDPLLDAFDCPDPAVKTPRRGATITPLQALELMNNAFVQRQAKGLAQRALNAAAGDPPAAIQTAYRLALGRPPTAAEARLAQAAAQERGLPSVCWALLNSTEFVYVQ
jgi:mono/diheme cytochrome c family protein